MDDVELDLRNVGVKNWEQELWTEQTGCLWWGKPRPYFNGHSVKEEGGGGEEDNSYLNNFTSHTVTSLECPGLNFPNSGYHTFHNGF